MIQYFVINKYSTYIEDFIDEDTDNIVSIIRRDEFICSLKFSINCNNRLNKESVNKILDICFNNNEYIYTFKKRISKTKFIELKELKFLK